MKKFYFLTVFLCSSFLATAQVNIDFGFHGGVALYSGDLSPQPAGFSLDDLGPTGGVFVRFQFSKWLGLRTGLNFAQLKGDDLQTGSRNWGLNFQTNIYEVAGIVEISPFSLGYYGSKTVLVPYLAVGAGAFRFNPRGEFQGELIDLQPLGTEGQGLPGYANSYSLTSFAFPFGAGLRFVVNDNITVGVELLGRKLQTDYIDDVSGVTVRYGDLIDGRGELSARISNPSIGPDSNPDITYRRGGLFNDFYYTSTISLSWRISYGDAVYRPGKKDVICPRF